MADDRVAECRQTSLIPSERLPEVLCALVAQSPVSTWIAGTDGTLLYQNAANKERFGIEKDEEVIGKYNIFRDEEVARQGYMPAVKQVFEEGGSTEFVIDYDFSRVRHVEPSHPTHRILRTFLFAIRDEADRIRYVVVQHEDVTDKWRAERSLEESEARYREVVETISDWAWAVDAEGRYTYSSPAVERVLGYKPDEVIGKTAFDFIIPEDRAKSLRAFNKSVNERTEIKNHLNRNRHRDGSIRYLETSGRPVLDEQGNVAGFRGIDRDVTERKLAEMRKRELDEHKREFYRRTILAATEGKLVISEASTIQELAGLPIATWDIRRGEDLSVIRSNVADLVASMGMDDMRTYDFVLAIGEATTNAYKHAGGGSASLHRKDDTLIFVVSDKGPGIEALILPEVALVRGYSTAGSLGMGYKAIISVADRTYLATGPTGTTVAIEMSLQPEERPVETVRLPDTWVT